MTLNDVMAHILLYFTEFGNLRGALRKSGWQSHNYHIISYHHITELTMALIHQSSVAPYIDNTIVINSAKLHVES